MFLEQNTYIVKLIADYFSIASVVVSIGYCPFKWPEQRVIHLEKKIRLLKYVFPLMTLYCTFNNIPCTFTISLKWCVQASQEPTPSGWKRKGSCYPYPCKKEKEKSMWENAPTPTFMLSRKMPVCMSEPQQRARDYPSTSKNTGLGKQGCEDTVPQILWRFIWEEEYIRSATVPTKIN